MTQKSWRGNPITESIRISGGVIPKSGADDSNMGGGADEPSRQQAAVTHTTMMNQTRPRKIHVESNYHLSEPPPVGGWVEGATRNGYQKSQGSENS